MTRTLLLISAVFISVALLSAQDDTAYTTAMKAVAASANGRMSPLATAITNKDVAAAAAEAKKVQAGYETMLAYWTAKKADDAIKLSTTGRDAAKAIADATDAGAQATSLMALRGTCNQCHMAHRTGTAPDFEIK